MNKDKPRKIEKKSPVINWKRKYKEMVRKYRVLKEEYKEYVRKGRVPRRETNEMLCNTKTKRSANSSSENIHIEKRPIIKSLNMAMLDYPKYIVVNGRKYVPEKQE